MWWRCGRRGGAVGGEWGVEGGRTLEESLCGQRESYFIIIISCSQNLSAGLYIHTVLQYDYICIIMSCSQSIPKQMNKWNGMERNGK